MIRQIGFDPPKVQRNLPEFKTLPSEYFHRYRYQISRGKKWNFKDKKKKNELLLRKTNNIFQLFLSRNTNSRNVKYVYKTKIILKKISDICFTRPEPKFYYLFIFFIII